MLSFKKNFVQNLSQMIVMYRFVYCILCLSIVEASSASLFFVAVTRLHFAIQRRHYSETRGCVNFVTNACLAYVLHGVVLHDTQHR